MQGFLEELQEKKKRLPCLLTGQEPSSIFPPSKLKDCRL
jgi:hypothetical protein